MNCDTEMAPDHQCKCEEMVADAERKFSEFRMRWIARLDNCTDDWALKSKLLESLEGAYLDPVSDISDVDFSEVKDKFFKGVLSPERFLEEMENVRMKILWWTRQEGRGRE